MQTWVEFCRSVKAGNSVGKVAATVLDRQERRTKTGNKMGILTLSDQTGHFEAIMFSEGLQRFREMLEPGSAVVLMLQAGVEGDEVRARIGTAERLDEAVAKHQKGMRIFLRDERPIGSVSERLEPAPGARARSLVLILDDGRARGRGQAPRPYQASPQIAGALRAVPGVVEPVPATGETGTASARRVASHGHLRPRPTPVICRAAAPQAMTPLGIPAAISRLATTPYMRAHPTRGRCHHEPMAIPGGRLGRSTTSAEAQPENDPWRFLISPCVSCSKLALISATSPTAGTRRWAQYIFGTRNNIHIIDLAQTVPMLHRALQA